MERSTTIIFDGKFVGIYDAYDNLNDNDIIFDLAVNLNPSVDMIGGGDGASLYELELIFKDKIIDKNQMITWFLLNAEETQLAIDLVESHEAFQDFISKN